MRTHHRLRERNCALGVACVTGVLSLLPLFATQLIAQGVLGELVDEVLEQPVAAAEVTLVDTSGNVVGRALSDTAGLFFIAADLGTYSLLVDRLGYEQMHVGDVQITDRSVVALRIRLSPEAVELPGLVVQGERRVRFLETNGFYQRKRRGFGHFIEIDRFQRLQTLEPTELVRRLPGIIVRSGEVRTTRRGRGGGGNCLLQLIVDGIYRGVNVDEALLVGEIEAIEVYNSVSNVPPKWQTLAFQGYVDFRTGREEQTCGIVVVWTKH